MRNPVAAKSAAAKTFARSRWHADQPASGSKLKNKHDDTKAGILKAHVPELAITFELPRVLQYWAYQRRRWSSTQIAAKTYLIGSDLAPAR